jgi:aspartate/tyrosine/aromatic aminotransferase
VKTYRYWDEKTRGLDFKGMVEDINAAPSGSIILLHACAHNPTGVDPTREQWKQIAEIVKAKNHFTFFDSAYQGFATGDLDGDAWAIRYWVSQGIECLIAQSFAKNFGLYDCRIGALTVVGADKAKTEAAVSQLEIIVRATYSNPPSHGARIVNTILSDTELAAEWRAELKGMADRIILCRKLL